MSEQSPAPAIAWPPEEACADGLRGALAEAARLARDAGAIAVEADHLVAALLSGPAGESPSARPAAALLRRLGIDTDQLYREITRQLAPAAGRTPAAGEVVPPSADVAEALALAARGARRRGGEGTPADEIDVLGALMILDVERRGSWASLATRRLRRADITADLLEDSREQQATAPATADPLLASLMVDFTALAEAGKLDPLVGREIEMGRVITTLCRRTKNNPLLVGEPGVGKTALAEGLAQRIVAGDVPPALRGMRVLHLTPSRLVANTGYRGQFESRVGELLDALRARRDVIVFIDELHNIVGAGAGGQGDTNDLANMLKPALARGELRCLGSTTHDEYRRYIESDGALERRFQAIEISEPTPAATLDIVTALAERYGAHHGVTYGTSALAACVNLAERYLPASRFPDKAIDLLDESGAAAALAGRATVGPADVAAAVSLRIGQPVSVDGREPDPGAALAEAMARAVVGQRAAIERVAGAVVARRLALSPRRAPLASFLVVGPAGCGKSSIARALADAAFAGALTTIDMAAYSEPHAVSMLRGTPPGYIGYEEPARLVDPLRHVPAQVVLLKHVDLAHPVVRETIADVLRNGELRDTRDRLASFRDAVVVLTMTVERGGRAVGFARRGQAEALAHGAVRDEAIKRLGPTLVELVDAVVPALPLDAAALDAIVERQLAELTEGARERGYEVDVELGVRELVAARLRAKGDARAVAYMLFEAVGEPLSRAIYAGPPRRLVLDVDGDRVVALARPRKPVSPARRARRQKVAA